MTLKLIHIMPYHTIQFMLFRISIFRTCSLVSVTMVVVVGMFLILGLERVQQMYHTHQK